MAAVQALLRQERLYTGPVDGVASEATTAAIRRYQILHGLRATGRLEEKTLRAMLAPPPSSKTLTEADRQLLRELAETPPPQPVAERRQPIPPGPPPPPEATPAKAKRTAEGRSGRGKSARHGRPATVRSARD